MEIYRTSDMQFLRKIAAYGSHGDFSEDVVYDFVAKVSNTASFSNADADEFQIYPNPANYAVHIKNLNQIRDLSIYNALGQLLKQLSTDNQSIDIDVNDLYNGIYLIVGSNNHQVIKRKLFIAK